MLMLVAHATLVLTFALLVNISLDLWNLLFGRSLLAALQS